MKFPRLLLTFGLVAAISACSTLPPLPLGPTATPSLTSTPTVTPTFTPSPTPIPAVRIESGDRALFNGDYDAARAEYRLAFDQSTDADTRAESLWGLARTEVEAGNSQAAIDLLNQLIREHPDHLRGKQAHFLLAESYSGEDRFSEAASAYGAYASVRSGILDAYTLERQGDAYFSAGKYAEALNTYNAATVVPRLGSGQELQIKIGQTRAALGDYAGALAQYDSIAQTGNDFIKAQMDYLSGSAYKFIGQTDKMNERFLHAVENYPVSYYSYLSLVELVDAGVPVSDLDRGVVDYFAGQYEVGIVALDRAIANGLDTDGTAHYYRALSLVQVGRYSEGATEFSYFIANYPTHPKWAIAWYGDLNYPTITPGLAFTQWYYLDQPTQAAQTLRDFAAVARSNPLTIDYLMAAARILERDDQLNDAAVLWETIADQFPGDSRSQEAIFLAGITFFRVGDFNRALDDFQRSLLLATETDGRARAYLWIGKTHEKLGDATKAKEAWTQGQSLDATTYYSVRARDLLLGRIPFAPASLVDLDVDLASERVAAETWMRVTFSLPSDTNLSGPGALASDPRFIRGTELWELGLYDEARTEFEDLRLAVSADAADTFRLANYLIDLGLYRSGIYAIRQVLTLAGYDEHSASLQVADYFNHIRYGLYFRELIEPAAQLNGFDTLFLFSVVRQESLFEGFAYSTASARGLLQILPDTGAEMAARMGWPLSFHPDMLDRPIVSVKLGTYYLASNRIYLNGDVYGALAAYNAGPGNALAWQELTGNDPDLYLEIVRPAETRNYIRGIYENYNIYRTLYSPIE
ncbi:MAG: transglycosylase SLT domain-containing protein [Chloroflexota bacterium]